MEAILFECELTDYERKRLTSLMETRVVRALRNGFGLRFDNLHTYPLASPDASEPVGSPRWAVWHTEHGGGVLPPGLYFIDRIGGPGKITNTELDNLYLTKCPLSERGQPLCVFDHRTAESYAVSVDREGLRVKKLRA